MNAYRLLTTALIFLLTACDQESAEPDQLEFRSSHWDAITCLGSGHTRCYGHRPTADELWSPVLSDCDLDDRVAINGWIETTDGYTNPCDLGGHPETFAEVRCFYRGNAVTCYGGENGWYTEVGPSCDTGDYTSSTWTAGCASGQSTGSHDYDHVLVSWTTGRGRAFDGADSFAVYPECKVAGGGSPVLPGGC